MRYQTCDNAQNNDYGFVIFNILTNGKIVACSRFSCIMRLRTKDIKKGSGELRCLESQGVRRK
jgi:hypothetical protein